VKRKEDRGEGKMEKGNWGWGGGEGETGSRDRVGETARV
jgi:hypothetical protein